MRKFQIGDIVTLKIKPNVGQMFIYNYLGKIYGGTDENPLYECKYYDVELKQFIHENFLESVLAKDGCE